MIRQCIHPYQVWEHIPALWYCQSSRLENPKFLCSELTARFCLSSLPRAGLHGEVSWHNRVGTVCRRAGLLHLHILVLLWDRGILNLKHSFFWNKNPSSGIKWLIWELGWNTVCQKCYSISSVEMLLFCNSKAGNVSLVNRSL